MGWVGRTFFYFSRLSKIEAGGRFFFFCLISIQCQEMGHIHTQYSRNVGTGITTYSVSCCLCMSVSDNNWTVTTAADIRTGRSQRRMKLLVWLGGKCSPERPFIWPIAQVKVYCASTRVDGHLGLTWRQLITVNVECWISPNDNEDFLNVSR